MNQSNARLTITGGVAALLLGNMAPALSHDDGSAMANAGYLAGTRGHVVMDSSGNCVRTSSWTPELAIPACDPGMMKKPEPVVEPEPAPMPEPMMEPKFETITMSAGALFDTNSATLKSEGQQELDELVSKLKQASQVNQISITGHTDSRGSAKYNQGLSERRADTVKAYLVEQGISADLITTSGRGEMEPVGDNATASGRASNRRVEIGISATQQVK